MASDVSILARFRRGAAEVLMVRVMGAALLFLMHVAMVRIAGIKDYGIISYTLAIVTILSLIAPLGWSNTILRFISDYRNSRQWGLMAGILRRAHQITFGVSVTAAISLWVLTLAPWFSPDQVVGMRFAAAMLPFTAFVLLRRKAFQALHRFKSSLAFEEVLLPSLVILGMFFLPVATASGVLTLYLLATGLVFACGSAWLWRSLPSEARQAEPRHDTRTWMAVSIPVVIGEIGFALINRIDQTVLGTLMAMEDVGIYAAAMRLASLNTFVLAAISTVAAPLLASAFQSGNRTLFRSIMTKAMTWSALAAFPFLAIMLAWPGLLLGIFGVSATEGLETLRILAVGQFVYAALGPLGICLMMIGRERPYALSMITVAALNFVALILAVPSFGVAGAAWVSTSSFIILGGWQLALLLKTDFQR